MGILDGSEQRHSTQKTVAKEESDMKSPQDQNGEKRGELETFN